MILILADDLSGAAELAGIAAQRGFTAEVQTQFDPSSEAEVIAIDTQTRSLPPGDAAERVTEVFNQARSLSPALIYKKTDSALRGNVQAEVSALAAAANRSQILLIPANPGKHRVIDHGEYRIDGTPLDQTTFKEDPEHPARTASVTQLVESNQGLPPQNIDVSQTLPQRGLLIPDIVSTEDIERRVCEVTPSTLCAGAAEFFTALLPAQAKKQISAESLPLIHSRFFVCGSLAAWQNKLSETAQNKGFKVVVFDDSQDWPKTAITAWEETKKIVVAIGNLTDSTIEHSHFTIFDKFINATARVIRQARPDAIHLEGGATAAALLSKMHCKRFRALPHPLSGVGCLQAYPAKEAPYLFIKPGSYPWPKSAWAVQADA